MKRNLARSSALVALYIATLVGAPSAEAGGAPPVTKWAWVVVRDANSSYDLAPGRDSGNSAGMTNHVLHAATGVYGVAFDGVGGTPGTFLVSALGTTPRVCLASEYATNVGPAQAEVRCYNLAGQSANATFVVNWLTASGSGFIAGEFGFGLNTSPTSNCSSPIESFISGGVIETCPAANNVARWKFEPIGSNSGIALVSAFAHRPIDDPSTISPGICDVVKFYPQPNITPGYTDEWVDVRCFEMNGTPDIYRENVVWYLKDMGMKGLDTTKVAYVLADKPKLSSYTRSASGSQSFSSTGQAMTLRRTSVGEYSVTFAGMPKGGSAQVSAYIGDATANARHCQIGSISKKTTPQRVKVLCFNLSGNPVNAKFVLAYAL